MSRWPVVQLGHVCEVIAGQSPPGNTYNTEEQGLPFFQGKADFGAVSPRPRVWTTSPERTAIPGDVLISVRAPVGSRNLADRVCAIGRGLNAIRGGEKVLSSFLPLVLELAEPSLIAKASGSVFQAVTRGDIESLEIILPPVDDQLRIVAEIEAKRAEAARVRIAAQQQSGAVHALVRCAIAEIFNAATSPVTFGQSALPGYTRLTDVARLETGHTPSRKRPDWWGGSIPWLALPDIRAQDGQRVTRTTECTNDEGLRNSSARLLPAGSVAFSRTASVGFVTILGREMAVSQDFAVWVCGPDLVPEYLMAALRFSREHLLTASSGAIHKTIYMDDLKSFQLLLPSVSEQRRIVERVEALNQSAGRAQTMIRQQQHDINAIDQAVLREAFT